MIDKEATRRIIEKVDLQEVCGLLSGLANIPSFSGEEGPVGRFVAERMAQLGFDSVDLQEAEPGRFNVLGTMRGDGSGIRFMFNGHLDIDPIPLGYDRPLWETSVEDGWFYGVGVGNMKGADAAMIMAAAAVRRAGIPLKGDIVVACVVGELQGGVGTAHLLDNNPLPDAAIVPEPTNLQIRTMHAGILEALVVVRRRAGTDRPNVAIERGLEAVQALNDLALTHVPHPDLPGLPRIHVGSVMGGEIVAARRGPQDLGDCCVLALDLRTHPGMTEQAAIADLTACLERLQARNPDTEYDLLPPPAAYALPWRAMGLYMPPLELPMDHPMVGMTAGWHERVTGERPPVGMHMPGSYAGADSGHLWSRGVPCFNYGPSQHSRFFNEIALAKLATGTKVMALTAADLCTRDRDEVLAGFAASAAHQGVGG